MGGFHSDVRDNSIKNLKSGNPPGWIWPFHSSAAREKFYSSAEQHQRNRSAIWSNYGFCVYFPCINDFQDCCQEQAARCTVVVPILIISLRFVTTGTLPKHQLFDSADQARISASTKDPHLWPPVLQIKARKHDLIWALQRAQKHGYKHKAKFFCRVARFLGSSHGRGRHGRQCCCTHTHDRRKCCTGAACKAAFVCTNSPSALLLQLQCPQRLTFQLWTADKEGVSTGTFLIKSADSNQPANLGLFFFNVFNSQSY